MEIDRCGRKERHLEDRKQKGHQHRDRPHGPGFGQLQTLVRIQGLEVDDFQPPDLLIHGLGQHCAGFPNGKPQWDPPPSRGAPGSGSRLRRPEWLRQSHSTARAATAASSRWNTSTFVPMNTTTMASNGRCPAADQTDQLAKEPDVRMAPILSHTNASARQTSEATAPSLRTRRAPPSTSGPPWSSPGEADEQRRQRSRRASGYSSLSASGSRAAVGSRMRTGEAFCHSPPDTAAAQHLAEGRVRSTEPTGPGKPHVEAAGDSMLSGRKRVAREVLEHHAEQPVPASCVHSAIGTSLISPTGGRPVEAEHQFGDGGFAGPVGTDQRVVVARLQHEADLSVRCRDR